MELEDKYNLAFDIIKKYKAEEDKGIVLSIANSIKENRFFVEYREEKIVLFITWQEENIDGKKRIFLNNLWVEENYRNKNTLTRLRKVRKYLFRGINKFYWFNRKKQKLIDRR